MNTALTATQEPAVIYQSEAMKAMPTGTYLGLFHGRTDPEQDMEDWGTNGPCIAIDAMHVTYKYTLRFKIDDLDSRRDFAKKVGSDTEVDSDQDDKWVWVSLTNDLLLYDGVYYGDWTIFQHKKGA